MGQRKSTHYTPHTMHRLECSSASLPVKTSVLDITLLNLYNTISTYIKKVTQHEKRSGIFDTFRVTSGSQAVYCPKRKPMKKGK